MIRAGAALDPAWIKNCGQDASLVIHLTRLRFRVTEQMSKSSSTPSLATVPVALLAGGLATRLGPISEKTPKALVDINGRAFIDHQLSLLRRHGFRKIVLCLGHLGQQIEQRLGDGAFFGLEISYSHDGPNLIGTGGAIRRALPMLGELFWVMYGDSYMDIPYADVLGSFVEQSRSRRPMGLMTVIRNEDRWDRSNAVFADGRLSCYDKSNRTPDMQYIDYGVQLLRRRALEDLSLKERFDLSDVYRGLVARGEMIGYEVFSRFYEIGTPAALAETRRYLSRAG
jgi:NDP-sugar pyrophosphorylase family protein